MAINCLRPLNSITALEAGRGGSLFLLVQGGLLCCYLAQALDDMNKNQQWYFVGLFDVLGFEARFAQLGLEGMHALYEVLIGDVNALNAHGKELKRFQNIDDEAIWTADGDAFVFNRVNGIYVSDSIVLWAHALFPEARTLSEAERISKAADPGDGWMYHLIPCDRFLDACNHLLCHSLAIGLPLRGAVALGPAIIDEQRMIFLGKPMVDVARAEKGQKIIGAAFTHSFLTQVIPDRFSIPFDGHIKAGSESVLSEYILDWARYWRGTRTQDIRGVVGALNHDAKFAAYYENTLRLIDASEARAPREDSLKDWSIRATYPQFSSPELKLKVRPVRRVAQPTVRADGPASGGPTASAKPESE